MNNKIMLLLTAVLIGLSARADYTVQTYEPFYYPTQTGSYSSTQQPYAQTYNSTYSPQYSQTYYNPYQAQYQGQYYNPAYQQYGNTSQYPYSYRRSLPSTIINSAVSGIGTTGGTQQIVKNIGQSMIYSMLRGY